MALLGPCADFDTGRDFLSPRPSTSKRNDAMCASRMNALATPFILSMVLASAAHAQRSERILLQGHGGYVFSSNCCQDHVDNGFMAGAVLGLAVSQHVWFMSGFNYYWLDGEKDLSSWENRTVFGALGYDITPSGSNGNMILFVGAGSFTFDDKNELFESRSDPVVLGGVKIVYDFGRRVAGTFDVGLSVTLSEDEFIGGDTWLLPIAIGLAFRI